MLKFRRLGNSTTHILQTNLDSCAPPYVITGDFNVHHPVGGGTHFLDRGGRLIEWASLKNFNIVNNGSPTYLHGVRCSSCLDLTSVYNELSSHISCFMDIETHGSDHISTYITYAAVQVPTGTNLHIARTD